MKEKHDIEQMDDRELLVSTFYDKVRNNNFYHQFSMLKYKAGGLCI